MWEEAEIIVERVNLKHTTDAVLTQMAISSMFDKKALKAFDAEIKRMTGNG